MGPIPKVRSEGKRKIEETSLQGGTPGIGERLGRAVIASKRKLRAGFYGGFGLEVGLLNCPSENLVCKRQFNSLALRTTPVAIEGTELAIE